MNWIKIKSFFKPTILTIILTTVFFLIIPMPTQIHYINHTSGSDWTISFFPSIQIIRSITSWDYEEDGVKYYIPPSAIQITYLILIAVISYLLACGIIFYINRRKI